MGQDWDPLAGGGMKQSKSVVAVITDNNSVGRIQSVGERMSCPHGLQRRP